MSRSKRLEKIVGVGIGIGIDSTGDWPSYFDSDSDTDSDPDFWYCLTFTASPAKPGDLQWD